MLGATGRARQCQIRDMPFFIVQCFHQIAIKIVTAVERQGLGENVSWDP